MDTRVVLTDPLEPVDLKKALALTQAEDAWLRNQQRKQAGTRSKYVPHQGAREKARRLTKGQA